MFLFAWAPQVNVLTAAQTHKTHPELNQEEGVLRSFSKQLLQPALLLRKFVVDLTYVHCLQERVAVRMIRLADVHKQMLVVLQKEM